MKTLTRNLVITKKLRVGVPNRGHLTSNHIRLIAAGGRHQQYIGDAWVKMEVTDSEKSPFCFCRYCFTLCVFLFKLFPLNALYFPLGRGSCALSYN